ncbi:MAG: VTT domain-containing protein [archaeon]
MHKLLKPEILMSKLKKLFASKFKYKIITAMLVILVIYAILMLLQPYVVSFLSNVNFVSPLYKLVHIEITNKSLNGLFFITLIGSLFCISYPAEVLFLLYAKFGYNPFVAALVMLVAIMVSQILNYMVGYFLGAKILHMFIHEIKKEYSGFLAEHDELFIILINIFPLPADILTVILGVIKYNFKKALLLSFIGQLIKYSILIFLIISFNGILRLI